MKILPALRILLHGVVLLASNLAGIVVGFLACAPLGAKNQVAAQLPIAVLLSIGLYLLWIAALRLRPFRPMRLDGGREYAFAWVASLVIGPLVFVPVHFLTQGYLTAAGNLIAFAAFQIPVNVIGLVVASRIEARR